MTLFSAYGGAGSFVFEPIMESVLSGYTRPLPIHTRNGVVRYQVDVGAEIRGDFGEGIGLIECVVDGVDKDKFQGDHASF